MSDHLCRCRHEPHPAYRCPGLSQTSASRRKTCRCTIPAEKAIELAEHAAAGHWWDSAAGTWKDK